MSEIKWKSEKNNAWANAHQGTRITRVPAEYQYWADTRADLNTRSWNENSFDYGKDFASFGSMHPRWRRILIR